MNLLKTFLTSEDGPSTVEYSVVVALIILVSITSIQSLGTKTTASFSSAKTTIEQP